MGIERHLFHAVSSIDGARQPYLVCAPAGHSRNQPLPVVALLHDWLEDCSPSGFIEEAFRTAHRWLPVLEQSPPVCLVQPYGRGNAGWLGWGRVDLFDTLADLAERLPWSTPVTLLGMGMGGTSALQLAAWNPGRFSAVAAVAPWTDWDFDRAVGAKNWPRWQKAQRQQLSPTALSANLAATPVYLDHPWWSVGDAHRTHYGHTRRLVDRLIRFGGEVEQPPGSHDLRRETPTDPAGLLAWLLQQHPSRRSLRFRTYSTLSAQCQAIVIRAAAHLGKAAKVKANWQNDVYRLKTKRVRALSVDLAKLEEPVRFITIDDQRFAVDEHAGEGRVRSFELLADAWQLIQESECEQVLTGLHLRSHRVAFVYGTLGDDETNLAMAATAQRLANAWASGDDSLNSHPGRPKVEMEFPVWSDASISEERLRQYDLVLVGTPRTHLLLARFQQSLPVRFTVDEATGAESFQLDGVHYGEPPHAVAFLTPNPEVPTRNFLILSSHSSEGYARLGGLPTALLPSYLVFHGRRVLDWGYWRAW